MRLICDCGNEVEFIHIEKKEYEYDLNKFDIGADYGGAVYIMCNKCKKNIEWLIGKNMGYLNHVPEASDELTPENKEKFDLIKEFVRINKLLHPNQKEEF